MNRPLVIYHGNCADGFTAAWCFWHRYGKGADYIAGEYQTPPPDVKQRDVYMVDFSYSRAVVTEMLTEAASVTLIDHHKTAIEDLAGLAGLATFTDLNRSGATLAWDYLFPSEPRPILVNYIEDRDLWRFNLPNCREIHANILSYEYNFENWDRLMATSEQELIKMLEAGVAIERKHHKDIAELVKVCKRYMTIGGHEVPVASLPYTLASEAANMMAENQPFAACYWDTEKTRVFGLRSTQTGLDVSEIAKQYGGGGHPRAAGFKVPRDHILAMS
jgi:oligoribonuclease NrnB/cAMP/cGMP phosphodiesterase (DHH superfamily)